MNKSNILVKRLAEVIGCLWAGEELTLQEDSRNQRAREWFSLDEIWNCLVETSNLSEKAKELKKEVYGGYKDYLKTIWWDKRSQETTLPSKCSESLKLDLSPNITA